MKRDICSPKFIALCIAAALAVSVIAYMAVLRSDHSDESDIDWDAIVWPYYLSAIKIGDDVYRCDWSHTAYDAAAATLVKDENVQRLGFVTQYANTIALLEENSVPEGEVLTDMETWVGQPYGTYNGEILLYLDEAWHLCTIYQ